MLKKSQVVFATATGAAQVKKRLMRMDVAEMNSLKNFKGYGPRKDL